MPSYEAPPAEAVELGGNWRRLVEGWIAQRGLRTASDTSTVSVDFDVPEAQRTVTVRFVATKTLLVAFMTDGRFLRPDQLALAAAAANAWNIEQLTPMLSVWDVRGPQPCLAGTCTLPLRCRLTATDFHAQAGDWLDQAGHMFTKCHQVFEL